MIFKDFQDKKLSQLGFGTMRLPTENGEIDQPQVQAMVDYAIENGVNYFDTAYPYHSGKSEISIGKALAKYPRESYYLATKYPGHVISDSYDPREVFEEQLKKCGVEYFDFYLLHNVYENSIGIYKDERWGIVDYFVKQKELGRIKHLGFSSHGGYNNLKEFVEYCGDKMEFCQLQVNYIDWTLQQAKEKIELLNSHNIPTWVMEPVRGGALAKLSDDREAKMKALRPDDSIASWALRFLQPVEGITMILSGMSNMQQMVDNVKTFTDVKPLTEEETALLLDIAETMKDSIPCTACRYCCDGCPVGIDIPYMISLYNEMKVAPNMNIGMRLDALDESKRPSACIGCGACTAICPQGIDIPDIMHKLAEEVAKLPSWAEISRRRNEEARRNKQGK